MTYDELHARHAVLEVKAAAAREGMDDGRMGSHRDLLIRKAEIEAEIKARPEHAAYIQSLIDTNAKVAAKFWI